MQAKARGNLDKWRATQLAHDLWKHEQGLKAFEALEPTVPLKAPSGPRPLGSARAKPSCLFSKVPGLPEADIPEHFVYLMASDYEAAKASMSPAERAAWLDYVGKPRSSALYSVHNRTRKRVEDGRVVKTYRYSYLEPTADLTPALERAALKVLAAADAQDLELVRRQQEQERLMREAEERAGSAA